MKVIENGITAPKGFWQQALRRELKGKQKDMAMVYSQKPCQTAGTFTTNVVKAAPVKWDKHLVDNAAYTQAIVCNSGIANACTGTEGYSYCQETAKTAAEALQIPEEAVLVASTGVIGQQLPIDILKEGVKSWFRFFLIPERRELWQPSLL